MDTLIFIAVLVLVVAYVLRKHVGGGGSTRTTRNLRNRILARTRGHSGTRTATNDQEMPAAPPAARQRRPKLEPIPHKMHGKNARAVLSPEAWRHVRRIVHTVHGRRCVECMATEHLECHEAWEYCWVRRDEKNVPVMRLVGLHTLCHLCHMGKHLGCARRKGELPEVKAHLGRIYGLSETELDELVRESNQHLRRLKYRYELDLSYLNAEQFGVVHQLLGRKLGTNELKNCRRLERS